MNVQEFASGFKGGGARQTLFQININNPVNSAGDSKLIISAKATQIPSWNVNEIPVSYMGRQIFLMGHRTYDPWTFTVMNDEDMVVRNALEQWSHTINGVVGNVRENGSSDDSLLKVPGQIYQYGKDGTIIRVYSMIGAWPQVVGSTSMAWDSDAIQEFDVTMRFDWCGVTGGTTQFAGGLV
jgi:hypothetical protein